MSRILSIIVVALNEAKNIARLKSAIDALEKPEGLSIETVLMDGGSSDGTADAARKSGFTKVVEMPGASIPVCRNRGLAEVSGEWIAFLDGDCEPAANWLLVATPLLDTSDPVIIGWPVVPPDPPNWLQRAWHMHWMFKVGRGVPPRRSAAGRCALPSESITHDAFRLITTRNMLLTRRAGEQLGGFDESLPTGEDTDFVFRAYHRGMTVLGVPALRVIHHGEPATLLQFFRQQVWHANRSSYRKIMQAQTSKSGSNAVLFSWMFTICILLCLTAMPLAWAVSPIALTLALPMTLLLLAPAVLIALRANRPSLIPALAVLYTVYGCARMLDLLGLHRLKPTWKR